MWAGGCRGIGGSENQWQGSPHFSCPLLPIELEALRRGLVRDVRSMDWLEDQEQGSCPQSSSEMEGEYGD